MAILLLWIISIVMLFVFIRIKQFPKINIWFVVLMILLVIVLPVLEMPIIFLFSDSEYFSYQAKARYIQLSSLASAFNYFSIVIVVCVQYFRFRHKNEENV